MTPRRLHLRLDELAVGLLVPSVVPGRRFHAAVGFRFFFFSGRGGFSRVVLDDFFCFSGVF